MAINITANSFRKLSFKSKIIRIVHEPMKALKELSYLFFSLFGGYNYTPFVILSRSRTGSNMLVQYLNSHPHIRCEYETLGILDNRSGPALVKRIYSKQPFFTKAKGFKIFYYHPMDASDEVFEQTWKALVSIPNLHMIHLKRVNVLETAISSKIAYQTGLYGNTGMLQVYL